MLPAPRSEAPKLESQVSSTGSVSGVEPSASLVANLRENMHDPLARLFIQLILINGGAGVRHAGCEITPACRDWRNGRGYFARAVVARLALARSFSFCISDAFAWCAAIVQSDWGLPVCVRENRSLHFRPDDGLRHLHQKRFVVWRRACGTLALVGGNDNRGLSPFVNPHLAARGPDQKRGPGEKWREGSDFPKRMSCARKAIDHLKSRVAAGAVSQRNARPQPALSGRKEI